MTKELGQSVGLKDIFCESTVKESWLKIYDKKLYCMEWDTDMFIKQKFIFVGMAWNEYCTAINK